MKTLLPLGLALALSFSVYAQDAANGKKLYTKCISCHGMNGLGKKSQGAPMIAAQQDWYIVKQIKDIRDQRRTNGNSKRMYPFVKNLTDSEVQDLAAYISKLPPRQ